jgi:hypothetical protein
MAVHSIALDVHCAFAEMAALNAHGDLAKSDRCPTPVPDLATRLDGILSPRRLTFGVGPLADWLARELSPMSRS